MNYHKKSSALGSNSSFKKQDSMLQAERNWEFFERSALNIMHFTIILLYDSLWITSNYSFFSLLLNLLLFLITTNQAKRNLKYNKEVQKWRIIQSWEHAWCLRRTLQKVPLLTHWRPRTFCVLWMWIFWYILRTHPCIVWW